MMKKMLVLRAFCAGIAFSAAIPLAALSAQATGQATSQLLPGVLEISAVPVRPAVPAVPQATPSAAVGAGPMTAPVAFRAPSVQSDFVVSAQDGPHGGVGNNLALVAVGAVGTFAGIKIGGGAGGTIAVAGAALALYGLYRMLR